MALPPDGFTRWVKNGIYGSSPADFHPVNLLLRLLQLLFFVALLALIILFNCLTWTLWLVALPLAYAGVKLFGRRS